MPVTFPESPVTFTGIRKVQPFRGFTDQILAAVPPGLPAGLFRDIHGGVSAAQQARGI
jgi:hypothetical protein